MEFCLFVKELPGCHGENRLKEGWSGNDLEAVVQARDNGAWSRYMTMKGRWLEGILGRWRLEQVFYCLSILAPIQLPAGGIVFWNDVQTSVQVRSLEIMEKPWGKQ